MAVTFDFEFCISGLALLATSIFGIIGNFISILILQRKGCQLKLNPTFSQLLTWSALIDTVLLVKKDIISKYNSKNNPKSEGFDLSYILTSSSVLGIQDKSLSTSPSFNISSRPHCSNRSARCSHLISTNFLIFFQEVSIQLLQLQLNDFFS